MLKRPSLQLHVIFPEHHISFIGSVYQLRFYTRPPGRQYTKSHHSCTICTSHVIETAGHVPRVRKLSDKHESSAMAGNYIKKSTVPFNESIPFTTKSGTVIEFIGRSFEKEFQIEIGAGSDIALYMKASEDGSLNRGFKTSAKNENVIISTSAFYKPPKDFKCSLKISSTEFTLSVGDGEVFTYTSGVEVELIDQLRFMGGIELKELRMNQ
ncbi:uncharacterized protein LOC124287509 [Haliotis rubra]|uniref:uncharacterized protein LOC124287509 n=1 Tax=Haliotis rubra TaxID=36100 RepID=UPI001EE57ECF|nr:uncharacterized protein LOC124287509 [Haliotis rubra]